MHLSVPARGEFWEKWYALRRTKCIKTYWVYYKSDDSKDIGVSPNKPAFLNEHEQQAKSEVKEKQAMPSVHTCWKSNTTLKNVVQEWNLIDFSSLNKPNWGSLYPILSCHVSFGC